VIFSFLRSENDNYDLCLLQAFKEALSEVRLCSRVEELLLKKKSITPGDSLEVHSQKASILSLDSFNFDL